MLKSIKLAFIVAISTLFFSLPALAVDGFTITKGQWNKDYDSYGYRFAPRWNWDMPLYGNETLSISGYWETSLGYWKIDKDNHFRDEKMYILAASPVFQFRFGSWQRFTPYFEVGVGVAAMTENTFGRRNLGSHFHFEDKLGFGLSQIKPEGMDISYRYIHYSNAGIVPPNSGLDFHTITVSMQF